MGTVAQHGRRVNSTAAPGLDWRQGIQTASGGGIVAVHSRSGAKAYTTGYSQHIPAVFWDVFGGRNADHLQRVDELLAVVD